MMKKKAEMSQEAVVVTIMVAAVIVIAMGFLFGLRLDLIIGNLPSFQGPEDQDREIEGVDQGISTCPEGYEVVGSYQFGTSRPSFSFEDRFGLGDIKLYVDSGDNTIRIPGDRTINPLTWIFRRSRDEDLGDRLVRRTDGLNGIELNEKIFKRGSSDFQKILESEIETQNQIFKALKLIDNSIITGRNQICQKTDVIENIDKEMNLIYWGVENPEMNYVFFSDEIVAGYNSIDLEEYLDVSQNIFIRVNRAFQRELQERKITMGINSPDYFGENPSIYLSYRATTSPGTTYLQSYNQRFGVLEENYQLVIFCNEKGEINFHEEFGNSFNSDFLIRLPDKEVTKEITGYRPTLSNEGYKYGCKTNLFILYQKQGINFEELQENIQEYLQWETPYYSSYGGNIVPERVTSP